LSANADEVRWLKKWTVIGYGPATSGSDNLRALSAPGPKPGEKFNSKSALANISLAEEEEEGGFGQYSGAVTPTRGLEEFTLWAHERGEHEWISEWECVVIKQHIAKSRT
jgi:hypothetical protein